MLRSSLTTRQEKFAFNLFQGMTQREAWINAGYSNRYPVQWIDSHACRLANLDKIKTRTQELRDKAQSDKVMSVIERKERLSEIARAKLTDFMELGQDGSWVNIGKETPMGGAIQEIHSRTEYDENEAKATLYTSVKLHDPAKAIDLLNKMDKLYTDGASVNIDNRKLEIHVHSEKARQLSERIVDGEGTGEDNHH